MSDERTYVRVHDGIEDHPKTAALSDKSFRLLITTWGWCSRHLTDGRVPLRIWQQRGTPKTRRELVDAALVEVYDDHVIMHDYLEHQRSAAEVEEKRQAKRKAGELGNHNRWHVGKKYDPECPLCVANGSQPQESPPSQEPSQTGSQLRSQKPSRNGRKRSPEVEVEVEVDTPVVTRAGGSYETPYGGNPPTPEDPEQQQRPPDRCPKHLDVDDPPPCGQCADARRAAEAFDAERQELRQRSAEQLAQALNDRRYECEHGTPGGSFIRLDGTLHCAMCRRATQEAQP